MPGRFLDELPAQVGWEEWRPEPPRSGRTASRGAVRNAGGAVMTATGVRAEDGPRAWQVLRRIPAYRDAWRRRLPQPGLPETAPFPVRLQTIADLTAARFGLHAWEDPFAEDGPDSPFWRVAPMLPAAVGPEATPLAGDAAAPGLSVAGLRLVDGSLVLKLERDGAALQCLIGPGSVFGPSDGVLAEHDLLAEPRPFYTRLRHARALAAPPPRGGGRGTNASDGTTTFSRRWRRWRPAGSWRRSRSPSMAPGRSRARGWLPTATCAPGRAAW